MQNMPQKQKINCKTCDELKDFQFVNNIKKRKHSKLTKQIMKGKREKNWKNQNNTETTLPINFTIDEYRWLPPEQKRIYWEWRKKARQEDKENLNIKSKIIKANSQIKQQIQQETKIKKAQEKQEKKLLKELLNILKSINNEKNKISKSYQRYTNPELAKERRKKFAKEYYLKNRNRLLQKSKKRYWDKRDEILKKRRTKCLTNTQY